jgi:histidinol-phosphate phosphatase family protein
MIQNKAIFFDRDDTLIRDSGYMYKLEDLDFFPETFKTLNDLQDKGYLLFIVTNQSGIGRGMYSEDDMHKFNTHMLSKLQEQGISITDLVFCPHAPEDSCNCRKPSPKLINELCEKYHIDKSLSWMVGDKQSDIDAGAAAGLRTFKIKNNNLVSFPRTIG